MDLLDTLDPTQLNLSIIDIFYSCNDENLSSTEVTPERWKTTTPGSATAIAVVLLIFMLVSIPANTLIIVVMIWKKLYRQPTHILLLNLTINDLLHSVTYMLLNFISAVTGEFIFGNSDVTRCYVCKTGVLFIIFANFNLHILALISIDRFLFIKLPFQYNRLVNTKTTIVAVVLTWAFSVLISLPPLFQFGEIRFTSIISMCSLYFLGETDLTMNVYYEVFAIVEGLCIPVAIIIFTNVWVICIVRKQFKKIYRTRQTMEEKGNIARYRSGLKNKLNKSKNRRQLRLVKIYLAILISNLLTWTPNIANTIAIFVFIKTGSFAPIGFFASNYLFFLSQVVLHPIIQTWLIPDIRRVLSSLWSKCVKMRQDPLNPTSPRGDPSSSSSPSCSCSLLCTTDCCRSCEMVGVAMLPAGGNTFRNSNLTLSRRHDSKSFGASLVSPSPAGIRRDFPNPMSMAAGSKTPSPLPASPVLNLEEIGTKV